MPITITAGNLIPNRPPFNPAVRDEAQRLIDSLEYADLWRGPGTRLRNGNGVRIDMQGHIPGPHVLYNIQVQTNGQNSRTIAHANVSDSIQTDDPANQKGATGKVVKALRDSLEDGHSYTVEGSIP